MRIGLYGLPSAGKTTLLRQIGFARVLVGSDLLRQTAPSFHTLSSEEQYAVRTQLALSLMEQDDFFMDGHYAFGDKTVFTEEDGSLYDVFVYLYIAPELLKRRMERSSKNRKYSAYPIAQWQQTEMEGLRAYCHRHNKDFYVLDHPPQNCFTGLTEPLSFLRAILDGYSCVRFAQKCTDRILSYISGPTVILSDGDRTLIQEDSSSAVFRYTTHLFDGNFYTGYQSWRQEKELYNRNLPPEADLPVHVSKTVLARLDRSACILTSGHPEIWKRLSGRLGYPCFGGAQMSADTKFFITKMLQAAGKTVTAYGDSMNDYYMLRQADRGYLVTRPDGSISRSLKHQELGGIALV